MNISMTGIDFNKADIQNRGQFALTQAAQADALGKICTYPNVCGCVIISTCNRMELWISADNKLGKSPYDILCDVLGINPQRQESLFVHRQGDEAVRHLFELACGLKSKIFGEEQILAQVKQSVAFARECGAADSILHALFRYAVTSAKKVKTSVRFQTVDRSVAAMMIRILKQHVGSLENIRCLVIGSGEIGRLAANGLVSEGCNVTMTLRQFKSGNAVIPSGCDVIRYEERYAFYPKAKVVISATRSPHYTIDYETVRRLDCGDEKILFDLAVPRDFEPEIAQLENITLFDIDHLGGSLVDKKDDESIIKARVIIKDEIKSFKRWHSVRALMPVLGEISADASEDVQARINYRLKNTLLDETSRQLIQEAATSAVSKVVEKILFTLHKSTDSRLFESCIDGLTDSEPPENASNLPLRFPLYVDLSDREVVVVGAGDIALRRITALLPFNCRITVTAPEVHDEIIMLHETGKLQLKKKPYDKTDIENVFLVVAATDDRQLNHQIAFDAGEKGLHCSIADCKEECTFYFPAIVPYEGGVIGICGTGEDHHKTKKISADIRRFMDTKENV